jgi:hypothetical protein
MPWTLVSPSLWQLTHFRSLRLVQGFSNSPPSLGTFMSTIASFMIARRIFPRVTSGQSLLLIWRMATLLWYTSALISKHFRLIILRPSSVLSHRFLRLSWLGVGSSFPGGSRLPLQLLHLLLILQPPNNLGSSRFHRALALNLCHPLALGSPAPYSPLGPLALRMPIKGGIHHLLEVLLKFEYLLAASQPLAPLVSFHINLLGLHIFCIPLTVTLKTLITLPFP